MEFITQNISSNYEVLLSGENFSFSFLSILKGILGIAVLIFIAWMFSTNRKAISWNVVVKGLIIQLVIALSVMFFAPVQDFFNFFGSCFVAVLGWTKAGSEFLFGTFVDVSKFGFVFAFQIIPSIIFFAAFIGLLFYLGIIQKVVWFFAVLMRKAMKLSGAESLATVANIFVGQNEAPLIVKPYMAKMTKSEIMLIMVAGMSTMAGGVLAAYVGMLGNQISELEIQFARHLLAASVMAAPAAVVISKILVPQTNEIETEANISKHKIGNNILDAISNGAMDGVKLAVSVAAMLLVFYALIAGLNNIIAYFGNFTLLSLFSFCLSFSAAIYTYRFFRNINKDYSYRFLLIASILAALAVANIYLQKDNVPNMLPNPLFAVIAGVFFGAISGYILLRRNKQKTINYYGISFAALAVLFITLSIAFFSINENLNYIVADVTDGKYAQLSMQFILGYAFAPVIWLIGVCPQDVSLVGELLGQKLILTEFVGYNELAKMLSSGAFFEIKSAIMAIYVLCGFANFASVGIQVGGIGAIVPNQKSTLSAFGMRALLGGTLTALVSATIIGMML